MTPKKSSSKDLEVTSETGRVSDGNVAITAVETGLDSWRYIYSNVCIYIYSNINVHDVYVQIIICKYVNIDISIHSPAMCLYIYICTWEEAWK